jgi:hypothetical protein
MAAQISPVLQAFFEGQQNRAKLLQDATDQANIQAERQQRQQQIDELVRQHNLENDRAMKEYDLAQDTHAAAVREANFKAMNDIAAGLKSGTIPLQGTNAPGTLMIPGGQAPGTLDTSGLPIAGRTSMAIPGLGPNVFTPNPTQTVDMGMGPMTVATPPTTDLQDKEHMDAVRVANDIVTFKATSSTDMQDKEHMDAVRAANDIAIFKATKEPEYQLQAALKDQQIQNQNQYWEGRLQTMQQMYELGIATKEELAQMKADADTAKRYGYRTPEQYQQDVNNNVTGLASGQKQWSEITDPQEKRDTQEALAAKGYQIPAKSLMDDIAARASDAERFVNVAQQMKAMTSENIGLAGQVSNYLRDLPGVNKFNQKASTFNSLLQSLVAPLEKAQGLSLSRAGSSVPVANLQKSITPSLTDTPKAVQTKIANAADVHLTEIADKIANMPQAQKILIWNKIATDNPDLMNDPLIGPMVAKAKIVGNYTPGGYLKRLVQ